MALPVTFGQNAGTGNSKPREQKKEMKALKKLQGNVVSATAKNSFAVDFSDVKNVTWQRGVMFDEAVFTKNGSQMTAYYDENGKLVGTTQEKGFKDLPAKGQQELNGKYKDYQVSKIIFFDDNELNDTDMYLYGIQFEDEDNYFAELQKGAQKLIVRIDAKGNVELFKKI